MVIVVPLLDYTGLSVRFRRAPGRLRGKLLLMSDLKAHFLLDPDVVFLNHGSFGATPRPVFRAYQQWQRRLEREPVQFIIHELLGELAQARQTLGRELNAAASDLVFVPNATFGVNIVARSLPLQPGDEILMSDHEYGACENIWEFIAQKTGAHIVRQPIPLPLQARETVAEVLWQGVTPRTKVIFLSQITSPTAIHLPVDLICHKARQAGIYTVVDGAHAPGQVTVDLQAIGADFYVGNCHKWMLAPKGAGFLYTRRELQEQVEPLVVSWGWGENKPYTTGSRYLDNLEWWGTRDPSAYLAVPVAIRFQEEMSWGLVRERCHHLLAACVQQICDLTGLHSIYTPGCEPFAQMALAPLPPIEDVFAFQTQLYRQHRIEVPCIRWGERCWIRVSIQGYNDQADIEALLQALAKGLGL